MVKDNIVLSGFMASGKSTVGALLSEMTGLPLVDTDSLVEEETGSSIREIFEREGEERFRELERAVIERESGRRGAVLAVGGGAVLDPANVSTLKSRGIIYLLEVSPEDVAGRAGADEGRPLLGGDITGIGELLAQRDSAYRQAADLVVKAAGRPADEVAGAIAADFNSRQGSREQGSPMDVTRIPVELGPRSYDVLVGAGLLQRIDVLLENLLRTRGWQRVVIVTDTNVGPLYAGALTEGFSRAGLPVSVMYVQAGEGAKSARGALGLLDSLAGASVTRSDLVVALGGGVVGDLSGFAASIFKRGVDILQSPTTLMAQVDASIGGKTAINLEQGKNLAGTFHQPVGVLCDVNTLKSLTPREYTSGLAEVAKYGFLRPGAFDPTVESSAAELGNPERADTAAAVSGCVAVKAEVVSADERDTGLRAVLNYGHTLGHALEAVTGYGGVYTHGEAVSVGMVFAAAVAEAVGLADAGLGERHRETLQELGLPAAPHPPAPAFDSLISHIAQDKKNRRELTMVLLRREGDPVTFGGLDWKTLERCYLRMAGV